MAISACLVCVAPTAFAKTARSKTLAPIKISSIHKVIKDNSLVSHNGYEIPFFSLESKKPQKYRFLLQSGIHGNERGAILFNAWLIKRLQAGEGPLSQLSEFASFDFIPVANPDGYLSKQRYNSQQVNLNRNFSIMFGRTRENPGAKSFSEPETRAVKSVLKKFKYTAAVDIHGYINWIVAPSNPLIFGNFTDYTPDQLKNYRKWMDSLNKNLPKLTGYELHTAAGLGDGGAFEDWAFWGNQTYAFCLEVTGRSDTEETKSVDDAKFFEYENFLFHMFASAIQLHNENPVSPQIASQNR